MNQDQIKDILLEIEDCSEYFTVTFTGKSSGKVDGLYYPDRREILIHNKNMDTESQILYTAIHEYAHHIHFCSSAMPVSSKSHTRAFWNIFHTLLEKAETKGIYKSGFGQHPDLNALTKRIKEEYIAKNGNLMKEFGGLLLEAAKLCEEYDLSFEDFVCRELGFHRTAANTLMKIYRKDINSSVGYENMAALSRIKDDNLRKQAEDAFISGRSAESVLHKFSPTQRKMESDPRMGLESERIRIKKTIETLQKKLDRIESELSHMN